MSTKSKSKKQEVQDAVVTKAVARTTELKLEPTLDALNKASVQITGTLTGIQAQVIAKHAEFQDINIAIEAAKEQLATTHGVHTIHMTIDEAKIEHQRALDAYAKEREQLKEDNRVLEEDLVVARNREAEQFTYDLSLKRKQESDNYNEQHRLKLAAERDRHESLTRQWDEREKALAARETLYNEAVAKAAGFDEGLSKAVKSAEHALASSMSREHKHEKDMAAVQHASAVAGLTKDIEASKVTIATLQTALAEEKIQNRELQQQVIAIAKTSVEGASSKTAQAEAIAMAAQIGAVGSNGRQTKA